jgi:hypothetical protein
MAMFLRIVRKGALLSLILSLISIFHPATLSQSIAGGTIGTQTPTALGATSSLAWTNAQASLDLNTVYISANPGFIYKSVDSATTWNPVSTLGYKKWTSVAVNDTATVVGAVASGDYVYISINSGSTWTQVTALGTANWTDIDINASGSTMIVSTSSTVKVTTDYGANWTSYSPGGSNFVGVAVNANGDKMAALSYNGSLVSTSLYLSSNTGGTWTGQSTPGGNDYSNPRIWMSRDGQKILFSRFNLSTYNYTTDFGANWSIYSPPYNSRGYGTFAATDDLSKVWVNDANGTGFYTTNSGSTWTSYSTSYYPRAALVSSTSNRWILLSASVNTGVFTSDTNPGSLVNRPIYDGYSFWSRVATSPDGLTIVAAGEYGGLSISGDGGSTWTYTTSLGRPGDWTCLAVSGDGNVIYAGYNSSPLYKSTDKGVTWSQLSGGSLVSGSKIILGCATNSDGSKVAVTVYGTGLLYSTNSGGTFALKLGETINTVTYGFGAVTFSEDGTKIAVAARYGTTKPIFYTTDSGATWTASSVTTSTWNDLKSTSDGATLIAIPGNTDQPQISQNWGSSWSAMPGIGTSFRYGIAINSDASVIVAGQSSYIGDLYFSTNKGATFTKFSGITQGYYTVAISGDASKIYLGLGSQRFAIAGLTVTSKVSFSSITIPSATATFRQSIVLTATIASAGGDGKVTFFANGKKIPGCIKKSSVSLVATCTWKPSNRGAVLISATLVPTDTSLVTSYSPTYQMVVGNRSSRR